MGHGGGGGGRGLRVHLIKLPYFLLTLRIRSVPSRHCRPRSRSDAAEEKYKVWSKGCEYLGLIGYPKSKGCEYLGLIGYPKFIKKFQ